jgi:glycosyltransferase involved in cell wall biosynthesis
MDISIIVPIYNEEESIPELVEWIEKTLQQHKYNFEVVLIDDGSNDNSWKVIEQVAKERKTVKGIKFRRNYGKSAALHTGFNTAQGDVIVTMDADLQDSPEEIPALYKMIKEEGYDLVSGWKKKRYDPLSKRIPSKFFNAVARWVTGISLNDFNCGLKAYRKKVVKSIEVYGEMHRYIPVLAKWAGFTRIGEKVVSHQKRKYGTTKFGFERFINGFLDLMSIIFIAKFAKKPMHLFGSLGTFIFIIGFFLVFGLGINKFLHLSQGIPAPLIANSPYFYLALVAMIIGSQLFLTGFIGELISRNALERNNYHIDKII